MPITASDTEYFTSQQADFYEKTGDTSKRITKILTDGVPNPYDQGVIAGLTAALQKRREEADNLKDDGERIVEGLKAEGSVTDGDEWDKGMKSQLNAISQWDDWLNKAQEQLKAALKGKEPRKGL